jgi:hypothetical protein
MQVKLAAPREKRFFIGERILFREIPGKNRRIQACLVNEEYFYGHSISPFKPKEQFAENAKYILAIVNSKLISWYGGYILPNFGKDIFPKLNPNDIKELPIPGRFLFEKEIIELVTKLLALNHSTFKSNINFLDEQIDLLVYKLFGLTEEEIRIVEGKEN